MWKQMLDYCRLPGTSNVYVFSLALEWMSKNNKQPQSLVAKLRAKKHESRFVAAKAKARK